MGITASETEVFLFNNLKNMDITNLNLEHPGANDKKYRARRNEIAEIAKKWRSKGGEIPEVKYSETENKTWETVFKKLGILHSDLASSNYLRSKDALKFPQAKIPQLKKVNADLNKLSGFGVEPVEGLVDAQTFLSSFERKVMPCSQFIRHHLKPEYTPEPDIVHEVVGHVPMFVDPDFVEFSEMIGRAARLAKPSDLTKLERLYWFTVEFGLIKEKGKLKVYGAGLLSSVGEIVHCLSSEVERKNFEIEKVITQDYDFFKMQNTLFVIKSFKDLKNQSEKFLKQIINGT